MAKLLLTEHDLQVHIFDVLRLNEDAVPQLKWVYAVPNGNFRSWSVGAALKSEGVKKGISDICVPFEGRINECYYPGAYIEMKAGDNKLSSEQKDFLKFVAGQGYATLESWHYDTTLDFIEAYCGIKLRGRDRATRKGIKQPVK